MMRGGRLDLRWIEVYCYCIRQYKYIHTSKDRVDLEDDAYVKILYSVHHKNEVSSWEVENLEK